MLFYSGDKVRIIKSRSDSIPDIAEMVGNVYLIEEVLPGSFKINDWYFDEDELELVKGE